MEVLNFLKGKNLSLVFVFFLIVIALQKSWLYQKTMLLLEASSST